MLVRFQEFEPPVEYHAIADGQHQQDSHQHFDDHSKAVRHCASMRLPPPPAVSNMTSVVLGRRSGLPTRTATRSPTRPIRPSVSVTSPQRTITGASDLSSSISVSPTSSFMICLS